jgi:quercetin dioxygenase-like cupin family protein
VLRGEAELAIGSSAQPLNEGQCLVLGANVSHSVVAHKETVLLLTIAMA